MGHSRMKFQVVQRSIEAAATCNRNGEGGAFRGPEILEEEILGRQGLVKWV